MPDARKVIQSFKDKSHFEIIVHNFLKKQHKQDTDSVHLKEAVRWICRAQDSANGGGVSGGYYPFYGGWLPPYPETTGYIISTLTDYFRYSGETEVLNRIIRMADWEIRIQLDSGAVRGGVGINAYPIVFNTGQVIHGWMALHEITGKEKYIQASREACNWLCSIQDEDGKWSKHTYANKVHSYNTLVSWAMLKLFSFTHKKEYLHCAMKNINWTLMQSNEKGWFKHMGFKDSEEPLTHTIAYTLQGLLESSPYLNKRMQKEIRRVLSIALENLFECYKKAKMDGRRFPLYATYDENWKSSNRYSCVTGNLQIAIVWLRYCEMTGHSRFLQPALDIINQTKAVQSLGSTNPGIKGAIPGSIPCWGKYNPFSFPNWAVKYFIDALLLKTKILKAEN
jgi:hypothetical protein